MGLDRARSSPGLRRRGPSASATGGSLALGAFRETVFLPALRQQLSQFPAELARLRAAWDRGEHLITKPMRRAHGHLAGVEEFVGSQTR